MRCDHVDIVEVTKFSSAEREGLCANCFAGFLADRNGGPWVLADVPNDLGGLS